MSSIDVVAWKSDNYMCPKFCCEVNIFPVKDLEVTLPPNCLKKVTDSWPDAKLASVMRELTKKK